jgi:hypothetical protein
MIEFVAGIVIGAVVGGLVLAIFVGRKCDQTYRQMYCVAAVGQLDVVRRLQGGQSEELIQQIVDSIPVTVTTVDREFASGSARDDVLHATRRFYEMTGREIPEGIRAILAGAPQRPVTCYKLQRTCSTDVKCIPIPTSLRPVSDTPDRRGWEKAETLCGVKKGWIWSTACGAPLTIGSCV